MPGLSSSDSPTSSFADFRIKYDPLAAPASHPQDHGERHHSDLIATCLTNVHLGWHALLASALRQHHHADHIITRRDDRFGKVSQSRHCAGASGRDNDGVAASAFSYLLKSLRLALEKSGRSGEAIGRDRRRRPGRQVRGRRHRGLRMSPGGHSESKGAE